MSVVIPEGIKKKWREEFYEWAGDKYDLDYTYDPGSAEEVAYLSARKKAHSENEDAFKAFTLDLADRYEKEIDKRDKLLGQSYVTMKYFACVSDEIIERKDAEQWLKDFQELKK